MKFDRDALKLEADEVRRIIQQPKPGTLSIKNEVDFLWAIKQLKDDLEKVYKKHRDFMVKLGKDNERYNFEGLEGKATITFRPTQVVRKEDIVLALGLDTYMSLASHKTETVFTMSSKGDKK